MISSIVRWTLSNTLILAIAVTTTLSKKPGARRYKKRPEKCHCSTSLCLIINPFIVQVFSSSKSLSACPGESSESNEGNIGSSECSCSKKGKMTKSGSVPVPLSGKRHFNMYKTCYLRFKMDPPMPFYGPMQKLMIFRDWPQSSRLASPSPLPKLKESPPRQKPLRFKWQKDNRLILIKRRSKFIDQLIQTSKMTRCFAPASASTFANRSTG